MTKTVKALFPPVCGTTTVGERGQVVIPAEIRKQMNLKTGDKLLVFNKFNQMVCLIKADSLDGFFDKVAAHFLSHVKSIKEKIKERV